MLKRTLWILGLFLALPLQAAPLPVLVWDQYFDEAPWANFLNLPDSGRLGNTFAFDPEYQAPDSGKNKTNIHGLKVAFTLLYGLPEVVVHRAHDGFLPWQGARTCSLTEDAHIQVALAKAGYPAIPNCRAAAIEGVRKLSNFLREKGIRVVNISHGSYYSRYRDASLPGLQQQYPKVALADLEKYIYQNFLALGEVVEGLFAENQDVVFVLAAGNYGVQVNQKLQTSWGAGEVPLPTRYGSYAGIYENVIATAASYDGKKLSDTSNFGADVVDFAKFVGEQNPDVFMTPETPYLHNGRMVAQDFFTGTSAAAAETSRLYARAILQETGRLVLTPRFLKHFSQQVATRLPDLRGKVVSAGLLEDTVFLAELAKLSQADVDRIGSAD